MPLYPRSSGAACDEMVLLMIDRHRHQARRAPGVLGHETFGRGTRQVADEMGVADEPNRDPRRQHWAIAAALVATAVQPTRLRPWLAPVGTPGASDRIGRCRRRWMRWLVAVGWR